MASRFSIWATPLGSFFTGSTVRKRTATSKTARGKDSRSFRLLRSPRSTDLTVPNAYGDLPLSGKDPSRPNEAYWLLVLEAVEKPTNTPAPPPGN